MKFPKTVLNQIKWFHFGFNYVDDSQKWLKLIIQKCRDEFLAIEISTFCRSRKLVPKLHSQYKHCNRPHRQEKLYPNPVGQPSQWSKILTLSNRSHLRLKSWLYWKGNETRQIEFSSTKAYASEGNLKSVGPWSSTASLVLSARRRALDCSSSISACNLAYQNKKD